jgi:hypothetical protein
MAARKKDKTGRAPKLVRKSILVDPVKLEQARKAVGASSNAELVRLALDQILRRSLSRRDEEE